MTTSRPPRRGTPGLLRRDFVLLLRFAPMSSLPRRSPPFARGGASLKTHAIHPAEKAVTVLLALWTVFQPWAFGTMHVWSQSIALALAVLAFATALYPRLIVADGRTFRIAPWRLLIRLPLFWLTVAVFAYAAVQALNPAWAYRQSVTHWWLERQPAIAWLPSGVEAPFERMNAWRKIFIWASPLLAGCAIWLGITRRRTAQALLVTLVVNATLVGVYAITQQAAGMKKIFWHFDFPQSSGPFGSFVYKNHAAAYLLVAFAAACGLAIASYLRGSARGARSTPAPVLGFLAVVIAVATVFSLSRLGAVLTALSTLLLLAAFGWSLRRRAASAWWLPLVVGVVLAAGAGGYATTQLDTAKVKKGLERLTQGVDESSPKIRIYAYHLTLEMVSDYPLFGIGAGGFRHLAPAYTAPFPAVTQSNIFAGSSWKSVRSYGVNETHSEPLQFAAEFGLVGGLLLAALAAFAFAALTRAAGTAHPLALAALVAFLSLGLFSLLDFPLHNPAIVAALVLVGTVCYRLSELDAEA
jgi:O-antigen ligase